VDEYGVVSRGAYIPHSFKFGPDFVIPDAAALLGAVDRLDEFHNHAFRDVEAGGGFHVYLGMRTVPSDGYGRTNGGHVMGTAYPSTVRPVKLAAGQRIWDGYGYGRCTVYGL
jgi:hypothetical protein